MEISIVHTERKGEFKKMNISNNLAGVRSDFSLYGIRENDKEVSVQNKAEELQKADCNVANKTMVQDYSKKSILMEYEKQKQESVFERKTKICENHQMEEQTKPENYIVQNKIESYKKNSVFKDAGVLRQANNKQYPEQCILKWEGHASAANVGHISTEYTSGKLNMSALINGTPIMGTACYINVKAENFEFKSGDKNSRMLIVDGANFNQQLLMDVTPKSQYKGKTLKFSVSIAAAESSVLYAKVGW